MSFRPHICLDSDASPSSAALGVTKAGEDRSTLTFALLLPSHPLSEGPPRGCVCVCVCLRISYTCARVYVCAHVCVRVHVCW